MTVIGGILLPKRIIVRTTWRFNVPCHHLVRSLTVEKRGELTLGPKLGAVKFERLVTALFIMHTSRVTGEMVVMLLLHASFDSMASGPCSNPWVHLAWITWLGNLFSWSRSRLHPINRTGRVPLDLLGDRLEVEASELSKRGLEDHLLVPDSGPACVGPLIRDLLEDVLHHVDLPGVVHRLVIEGAIVFTILLHSERFSLIVPRLDNALNLTWIRVRSVTLDIQLIWLRDERHV